ncbi:MAG: 50S ribosomal protein L3 [Planctomycetes bacterium]|nr:50S ribosomal protein L3 [Planctomycetota bacterium]
MPVGLLGQKIGMTQVYEDGDLFPVTVIEAGPCVVLQLRTLDRDGYEAVQLGFDDKPRRSASRSERGHVVSLNSKRQRGREEAGVEIIVKANCEPKRLIREFRTDGEQHGLAVGENVTVGIFASTETYTLTDAKGKDLKDKDNKTIEKPVPIFVDVIGTSKGRGFAGVMKRHNFSGQRATHGVKRVHRHGVSIGMSADPARVFKGTRMPGGYGNAQATVRHLLVVRVDEEANLLLVKGAVPGSNRGYLVIRPTNKH